VTGGLVALGLLVSGAVRPLAPAAEVDVRVEGRAAET
jgi:hypothetical protein